MPRVRPRPTAAPPAPPAAAEGPRAPCFLCAYAARPRLPPAHAVGYGRETKSDQRSVSALWLPGPENLHARSFTHTHARGQLPVRLYCYGPNAERGPRPRSRGTLARRAGACRSGRRGRGPQGDAGARVGDSAAALGRGLRLCITPWNRTRRACRPGPAPGCCPLTLTGAKINTSWVRIQTQTRGSRSPAFAEEGRLSQEPPGRLPPRLLGQS